jgi:hypothetical protein
VKTGPLYEPMCARYKSIPGSLTLTTPLSNTKEIQRGPSGIIASAEVTVNLETAMFYR